MKNSSFRSGTKYLNVEVELFTYLCPSRPILIMNLRENSDAYVDFVLGLFQLSRDEKDLSGKYRLTNIFGEKDGDPA